MHKETFITIVLFLVFNSFFRALSIPNAIIASLLFLILLWGWNVRTLFRKAFVCILCGFLLSSISCSYYRGQSLFESFQALNWYYGIFIFFYLNKRKYNIEYVEMSLPILIIMLDVLYIAQYYLIDYGINFLQIEDWMLDDKSVEGNRLRVMSSGLYSLGIFFGIVKYREKNNVFYLALVVLGIYIMLLSGFRQLLASLFITVLFMLYKYKFRLKLSHIFAFVLLLGVVYYICQIPEIQNKFTGMMDRNENQTLDNDDYVRILQLNYYLNNHFKSPIEFLLGSGIPYYKSAYGQYISMNYSHVDWGIIGQSWALGIITALGFLLFAIKSIRLKVDSKYSYISLWYIFLLLSSITNYEFFRDGNFLIHGILLYIVEKASLQKKQTV